MKKKDIASYTFQELEEEMKLSGEKGFRAKQIYEWIHVKMAESFGEMTNLSKTLREKLDREYEIALVRLCLLYTSKLGVTAQVVRALEEKKILTVERETVFRNPVRASGAGRARITYTEEQQEAIRIFQEDYERARFDTYLLYGVTGSGKTEVYMEMIRTVVSAGRQAIVLIPVSYTHLDVYKRQSRNRIRN